MLAPNSRIWSESAYPLAVTAGLTAVVITTLVVVVVIVIATLVVVVVIVITTLVVVVIVVSVNPCRGGHLEHADCTDYQCVEWSFDKGDRPILVRGCMGGAAELADWGLLHRAVRFSGR
jgi:hypothetical protein